MEYEMQTMERQKEIGQSRKEMEYESKISELCEQIAKDS